MFRDKTKIYIPEVDIQRKCGELGKRISKDYAGKDLVLVVVLKGSIVFFSDLVRHITLPVQTDFIQLSSYGHGMETSGQVKVLRDITTVLDGKHVLIIEDILDTGLTLSFLKKHLEKHSTASVKICTFLDKPSRRRVKLDPDYCGFEIDDHFVIGYGLDYQEICRNYSEIYQVTN